MKKVLLFTHSQDIDGMGCAVLGLQAFSSIDVVPTATFDITRNVKEYIENGSIYHYDQIFVTDLCIKEPVLRFIDSDPILKQKLIVLDHHKTEIEEGNNQYDFVHIVVEKNGRKESGTSLFYDYLLSHQYLKESSILNEFVELTRSYDVWDWKKEGKTKARELHILFELVGYRSYVSRMCQKIKTMDFLEFNEQEKNLVLQFEKSLVLEIQGYLKNMKVVSIATSNQIYKVGFIRCLYRYRNEINEWILRNNEFDLDVIGMIMDDTDTVSYRQIKGVDVSVIAKIFGGKGHFSASSNSKRNESFQKMLSKNQIIF